MSFLYTMGVGFALMVPAFASNMAPSIIRGKRPIDFGKNFFDGRRILGDGKTIRGFISGIICGIITALIFAPLYEILTDKLEAIEILEYAFLGFLLGFGTVLGDSMGSFIKRRFNVKRGETFPILDQLDFMLGAILMLWLVWSPVTISLELFFAILIMTGPLHLFGNYMAYKLGNKESWY